MKYSPDVSERAVRMFTGHQSEHAHRPGLDRRVGKEASEAVDVFALADLIIVDTRVVGAAGLMPQMNICSASSL